MRREEFEKNWEAMKGKIQRKWNKLTEQDMWDIDGDYQQFMNKMEERYEMSREQAERDFGHWDFKKEDMGHHEKHRAEMHEHPEKKAHHHEHKKGHDEHKKGHDEHKKEHDEHKKGHGEGFDKKRKAG